jgi:hypothetical protein
MQPVDMDITDQVISDLNKRLRQDCDMERVQARVRQARIASTLGQNRKAAEGLGRVRMEVDTQVFHAWGQKYGYKIWRDESFLRAMERDNPETRVRCGGTGRMQFGYMPSSSSPGSKFHKTYATP